MSGEIAEAATVRHGWPEQSGGLSSEAKTQTPAASIICKRGGQWIVPFSIWWESFSLDQIN